MLNGIRRIDLQNFRLLPKIFVRYTPEPQRQVVQKFPKFTNVKVKKEKHCITDEQVLEMRWLVKFGGKSYKEVAFCIMSFTLLQGTYVRWLRGRRYVKQS